MDSPDSSLVDRRGPVHAGAMLEDLDRDLIQIAFLAGQIEAEAYMLAIYWLWANHQVYGH